MQHLITLVGLTTLANAASLVTTGNMQMAAKAGDKTRQDYDGVDDLDDGLCLGGPLTGINNLFCDPVKKDTVCEQRYLNTFCDFTIDNDANNLVYNSTKTLWTKLDLPSSIRFVTQTPPTTTALYCPY